MLVKHYMQRTKKRFFIGIVFLFLFSLAHTQCQSKTKDAAAAGISRMNSDILLAKYTADTLEININDISGKNSAAPSPTSIPVDSARQIQELIKQRDYAGAEKLCTDILTTSPENNEIRYLRGMLNQKLGNSEKAIEDYDFLVSSGNADGKIFNNLGVIYAQQEKYTDAAKLFSKAVHANPQGVEFRNNLAEVLLEMKEYGRAIEEYTMLLSLEPDNTRALYNLGVAYKNIGDDAKAKEQWERVLAAHPEDPDAKNALECLEKEK
ncbi:MAG: tetratricopeptide repeat protein [Candidatus Omnitrophota bacterium]